MHSFCSDFFFQLRDNCWKKINIIRFTNKIENFSSFKKRKIVKLSIMDLLGSALVSLVFYSAE